MSQQTPEQLAAGIAALEAQLALLGRHACPRSPIASHTPHQGPAMGLRPRFTQSKQQQAGMLAWGKLPGVGEVEILCDEKAAFHVHGLPDLGIRPAAQLFVGYGVNIVAMVLKKEWATTSRAGLVQLDLHVTAGVACSGRSSSAETAAKATTARTASRLSVGKSSNSSSVSMPSARLASTVRTVTRVPVTTGSPPQIEGSRVM
jgi:hypothetical protein